MRFFTSDYSQAYGNCLIVDSNSISKRKMCVWGETKDSNAVGGRKIPAFHCAPAKEKLLFHQALDRFILVGRWQKRFPFYTHVCSGKLFLSLPRRLSLSKQNAFSLNRVAFVRKEKKKKMYAWTKKCVLTFLIPVQEFHIYFLLLLFFPPLQLLFVLGCVRDAARVCLWGIF